MTWSNSSELVEQSAEAGELVLALDGTTVDEAAVAPADALDPPSGAMPPSSISTG